VLRDVLEDQGRRAAPLLQCVVFPDHLASIGRYREQRNLEGRSRPWM
jgi:hypothetical protein